MRYLSTTLRGTGLHNLADRLTAVGGTITIQPAPVEETALGGQSEFA